MKGDVGHKVRHQVRLLHPDSESRFKNRRRLIRSHSREAHSAPNLSRSRRNSRLSACCIKTNKRGHRFGTGLLCVNHCRDRVPLQGAIKAGKSVEWASSNQSDGASADRFNEITPGNSPQQVRCVRQIPLIVTVPQRYFRAANAVRANDAVRPNHEEIRAV